MNFQAWGPFPLDPDDLLSESPQERKDAFWRFVSAQADRYDTIPDDLYLAVGCYIFCIEARSKLVPWYVGKTNAASGFYKEILTPHKLNHYRQALEKSRGAGKIILFPLVTSTKISRASKSSGKTIDWLERMLIGMALVRNPELQNKRDTHLLKNVWVEGVFGQQTAGRPNSAAAAAKKALFG